MTTQKTDGWSALLMFVGIFALIPYSIITNGWVLSHLWRWFVSHEFGVREISIGQGVGLMTIVSFVIFPFGNKDTDKTKSIIERFSSIVLKPFAILGFGWIIHLFLR